ncbi:MAG: glycosyltransferase [Candidatus Shapirobacteria bacterium]|nr:glycosyltransferase [Candidatus Shapirobacteria bacterium]
MKKKIFNLQVVLVHDYLKEFGGAEAVLETLSEIFPKAPIFTTLYCPKFFGPHQDRLEKKWHSRIHQSFFQFIPFAYKIVSPLRLLSPLAFKSFDFSSYDLIITSATGAYFPNSLNKKGARLICYCHTPPRYLYGLPTARNLTNNKFIRLFINFINHFLRLLDFHFAKNVDLFIANSNTTSQRIKKFYRRESTIINPPIDILKKAKGVFLGAESCPEGTREHLQKIPEQYYITGGRLARAKRYDIAIQACNQLKVKLKIFGRDFANFESELKQLAGPTVEFLGEITQSQKSQLLATAEAFIFCSDNEDFGIVPVEAMAYGCPVVAYKSGGTAETVIEGQTGIFFTKLTADSCVQAIKKLSTLKIDPKKCIARATEFSTDNFIKKIKASVSKT